MTTRSYYNAERENGGLDHELERLEAQLHLSWERELRLLKWLGLRDGMSILDVGCGPGFMTEQLQRAFPNSPITALDVEPLMISLAQQHLQDANGHKPTFVIASIDDMGLPDNAFDFAIARYVFQHLPQPIAAAREILRVLRVGGTAAVIDVDAMVWGIVQPYYPQLHAILGKSGNAQAGGDRLIGRKLWRILHRAGFADCELDSFVYHSDAQGIDPFLPQVHPDRLLRALQDKQITLREYATVQTFHKRFLDSAEKYLLMCGLIASGTKTEAT